MQSCIGAQFLVLPKPNQVKALKGPSLLPLTFNPTHSMTSKGKKRDFFFCPTVWTNLSHVHLLKPKTNQLNVRALWLPVIIKGIFVWNSGSMIITNYT